MDWDAAWPPARKKPLARPLIVAAMLVTVAPPPLVMMPPTYMARGPELVPLLLSMGIDCVPVAASPVRRLKLSCACAGAASPVKTIRRKSRERIMGEAPARQGSADRTS